jgi:hemerythrin-like domain-containing protein
MTDVFDALSSDHAAVRQMLAELEAGPTAAAGADDGQLRSRKKLAERLVIEESRHEAAEQMYVWPAVRDKVDDGGRLADQALSQEQEGEQTLSQIDGRGAADPEFEQAISQFITAARQHMQFEETEVWPRLRTALTEKEIELMADQYQTSKQAAPTRPHPGKLESAEKLRTGGPMVAAMDRARDALTRRGKD